MLVRAVADVGLLSALGTTLAAAWLLPPGGAVPGCVGVSLRRLALWSVAAALLSALAWLACESAVIGSSVADVPLVLTATQFGHLLAVRLVLLAGSGIAAYARRGGPAAVLAAAAVATQAGHDHAWAMAGGPSWLVASNAAHVVAAGAWLGGLLPLLLVVRRAPPAIAAGAALRFSALGGACVAVLAVTALLQGWVLIGGIPGLDATAYGWTALLKLALFLALVALAARNRLVLTPALGQSDARRALARSIALEMALGLLVVTAAALLTSLPPAMHGM